MKKSIKAGLVLAALAGTTTMMIGGASAANAAPGEGNGALSSLVTAGTITSTQAKAIHDQLHADRDAAKASARSTALATLVSEGTLTQSQATAVAAADREGVRALVQAGTITRAQADAIKAEFQEYGSTNTNGRSASLATLVSNGTITQAQSTAIAVALPAPGSQPKPDKAAKAPKPAGSSAPTGSAQQPTRGMNGARGPAAPSAAPSTAPVA